MHPGFGFLQPRVHEPFLLRWYILQLCAFLNNWNITSYEPRGCSLLIQSYGPPVSAEELSEWAIAKCEHQWLAIMVLTKPGRHKMTPQGVHDCSTIQLPLHVHTGQGYYSKVYLRILDRRMAISCTYVPGRGARDSPTWLFTATCNGAWLPGSCAVDRTASQSMAAAGHPECRRGLGKQHWRRRAPCSKPGRSSQVPTGILGPSRVLRAAQQLHLKQTAGSRVGMLVTRLCPPEGDASLQGGSVSGSTLGCASLQPGLSHARSHRGIAVQGRPWSLHTSHSPCTSLLFSRLPNTDGQTAYGTYYSETLLPSNTPWWWSHISTHGSRSYFLPSYCEKLQLILEYGFTDANPPHN